MGDDPSERPAEKIVRPCRTSLLDAVGVVCGHVANRLRLSLFGLQRLLDPDDRAIQVLTESLIRPAHAARRMNAEQRNTGAALQSCTGRTCCAGVWYVCS